MKIKCVYCGKETEDNSSNRNRKYCNELCRNKYRRHGSLITARGAEKYNETQKKEEEMKKPELVDVQELSEELIKKFKQQDKLIRIPKKKDFAKGRLVESAVLTLSDIHVGQKNKFLEPESGLVEETYNVQKTIDEMARLLDSIKGINFLLAPAFRLEKLYVFGLGDLVENDVIFKGQRFFVEKGVGDQLMLCVKILTELFQEFLKMYDEVEFINIIGNHGRFQSFREASPAANNFDYLVGKILEIQFQNEPRIKITAPESWYYLAKIYDWKYFLHHGDTVYSWMSLPYYGLKRQGTARRVEVPYDVECIGHFHQLMEIPIGGKTTTLVNGGWIKDSDFAWRKFGVRSTPKQWYFGVSPKRPQSWVWKLDLLHSRDEWKQLRKE